MTSISGYFINNNGDRIDVSIYSASGSGVYTIGDNETSPIQFSIDPVTISTSIDNLFTTVIKKSCTISLMTHIFLGDVMYGANPDSVSVQISKNGEVIFDGYAEPNTYNQPYVNNYDEYQFNCVDKLSLLQNKYWDHTTMIADTNTYSFKSLLQKLGLSSYNVFYDGSATVDNESAFEKLGVSLNVFLGENQAAVKNYEEVLDAILKFMNLHILQEGSDLYIFNWETIKNSDASWTALFGSGTPKSTNSITVTDTVDGQLYRYGDEMMSSDNSTNVSIDTAYNKIQVRANIKPIEDLVPDPFNDGDLEDVYPGNPSLCITEAWYDESRNYKEFGRFIKSQMFNDPNSIEVDADGDKWHAKDWYMSVQKNNKWNLYYHDNSVLNYVSAPQTDILTTLYENKFMPMLIKFANSNEISNRGNSLTRRSALTYGNYLVFSSCAGWSITDSRYGDRAYASKAALSSAIDNARKYASGTLGLFVFDNGSSINVSPKGEQDINYITLQGTIRLEPHHCKAGTGVVQPIVRSGEQAYAGYLLNYMNMIEDKYWLGSTYATKTNGTIGYYQQMTWRNGQAFNTQNYLSPPVGACGIGIDYYQDRFTYNQSKTPDGWSDNDTINKIPIFECELKVGDKYCVEDIEHLDNEGCPTYHWLTAAECTELGISNKSITLGFNPAIGDFILAKDYEFTNTADGRYQKINGMSIPVRKTDNLNGSISFKIKGILPVTWDSYFSYEVAYKESEVSSEGSYNLWEYVSSIWLKNFRIKFDSNVSANVQNSKSGDVLYVSDVNNTYVNKYEEIDFDLTTQLTNDEILNFGLSNSSSYGNVINIATNDAIEDITEPNGTNRAEKLYVDQYYGYYCDPKIIFNKQIFDNGYTLLDSFTFAEFGRTIPMSLTKNLKYNTVDISGRQI